MKKDSKKPTMKVQDLEPQADPKGGALNYSNMGGKNIQGHKPSPMKPPGGMDSIGSKPPGGMDSIGSLGESHKKPRR